MAIPLWRQYSRLTPDERRAIIRRRRTDLNDASSRDEVLRVFRADERDIRNRYRDRDLVDAPAAAAAVDNSPFARQQRAFEGLNERDGKLARQLAGRTSIPVEDIPGELASYREQIGSQLSGRTPAEIDTVIANTLARNFPK